MRRQEPFAGSDMLQARTDTARGQDPSDGSDILHALSKAICLQNIISRADRSHPMAVTYYVGSKSVDRSNPLAKYISRANTREYLRTEEIRRFTCPLPKAKPKSIQTAKQGGGLMHTFWSWQVDGYFRAEFSK